MRRFLLRVLASARVFAVALSVLYTAGAQAVPITWNLSGVTFDDGGTASGSFVYDRDTTTYSNISISTTTTAFRTGTTYGYIAPFFGSDGLIQVLTNSNSTDLLGADSLWFVYGTPLSNTGGTIGIRPPPSGASWEGTCAESSCRGVQGNWGNTRWVASGSVTATSGHVVPAPPDRLEAVQFAATAYDNGSIAPPGYNEIALPQQSCSLPGFCAKAFKDQAGDRIVLAIAGTDDLQDWIANGTFFNPTGTPTPTFDRYVGTAVADLLALKNQYPAADITLTGHSLGGAIAQVLATASGHRAITFNAPGAAQTVSHLANLGPLQALPRPSGIQEIINYRIYGDLVSTVGSQAGRTTVTFEPPIPKLYVDNFPIGTAKSMHLLLMMHERLFNNAPISSNVGPTALSAGGSLLNTAVQPSVIDVIRQAVNGVVLAGDVFFIDPQDVDAYHLSGLPGSPLFQSVMFPYLFNTDAKFRLEGFENNSWISLGLFDELESYDFGSNGVDQFRFFVLDLASLLPATSVEPFNFGVSFVSDGEFNGTLTAYSTITAAIPEPSTIYLLFVALVAFTGFRLLCVEEERKGRMERRAKG